MPQSQTCKLSICLTNHKRLDTSCVCPVTGALRARPQPQLPVTAVCCYCSLTGWGRPLSPVAGKRNRPEQKSTLYECRSCFRIAHIACTTRQVSGRRAV